MVMFVQRAVGQVRAQVPVSSSDVVRQSVEDAAHVLV
jgi:hypothetical protein